MQRERMGGRVSFRKYMARPNRVAGGSMAGNWLSIGGLTILYSWINLVEGVGRNLKRKAEGRGSHDALSRSQEVLPASVEFT